MWHKPCRTFHPWCLCIKTRCLDTYDSTGRGPIGPYDQIRNRSWCFSCSLSCYFSFLYLIFVFSLSFYFSGCARLSGWGCGLKLLPSHIAMGGFSSVCQAYFLMRWCLGLRWPQMIIPALCQSDCQTPDQFSTKHVHSSSEAWVVLRKRP